MGFGGKRLLGYQAYWTVLLLKILNHVRISDNTSIPAKAKCSIYRRKGSFYVKFDVFPISLWVSVFQFVFTVQRHAGDVN